MPIGLLTLHIHLPGCSSLKEKRSRIKPLLARLRREFNISVAEMDYLDAWQESLIACVLVSNDHRVAQSSLQHISNWIEDNWPDIYVAADQIEIL
jgi:hypothetical protein